MALQLQHLLLDVLSGHLLDVDGAIQLPLQLVTQGPRGSRLRVKRLSPWLWIQSISFEVADPRDVVCALPRQGDGDVQRRSLLGGWPHAGYINGGVP